MKYLLSVCFLMATYCCTAQPPFADGKNIHTRTILDGRATMLLPDDYSYGRPMETIGEPEYIAQASYGTSNHDKNIYCSIHKNEVSEKTLFEHYNGIKSMYSDKYVVVLTDEFVPAGEKSYFYYECVLKDELYRNPGEPAYEINDTAVTGVIIPNYFCFYHFLHEGKAVYIATDYQGSKEGIEDFRQLWAQMKNSFALLKQPGN